MRERATCKHCGNRIEDCSDPTKAWYPFRVVCYATMEAEAARQAYEGLHNEQPYHDGTFTDWSAKRSRSHPYHALEAVSVHVSPFDLTPWDEFTTKVAASPHPPKGPDGQPQWPLYEPGTDPEEDPDGRTP